MTTTITPEQADTLPAEAIDLDALAELARKATPGPWRVASDLPAYAIMAMTPEGEGGHRVVQTPNQNNYRRFGPSNEWDGISQIANAAFIAALDPTTVLALIDLARRADDHYFAVDYTGCIHDAPDRETAIKWAEDFARTANGGAIGSERPEVAAAIGSLARRAAVPSEQEPVLSASPSPPALDGAARDAVLEEIAKWLEEQAEADFTMAEDTPEYSPEGYRLMLRRKWRKADAAAIRALKEIDQ